MFNLSRWKKLRTNSILKSQLISYILGKYYLNQQNKQVIRGHKVSKVVQEHVSSAIISSLQMSVLYGKFQVMGSAEDLRRGRLGSKMMVNVGW